MRETWYVLEDGSVADPSDVVTVGDKLAHKDGRPVAMRGTVPSTRNIDPDEERATVAAKEIKPESAKRGYKTRDMKAVD